MFYNSKSEINSLDQTLDEALNQINQLKEDMTGLCEDIDILYNTKKQPSVTEIKCICHFSNLISDKIKFNCFSKTTESSGITKKKFYCLKSNKKNQKNSFRQIKASLITNGCKKNN